MNETLRELARDGQSIWYDGLRRDLITTRALLQLVDAGVRGLTTNPSIYEKAIAETRDYDADIAALQGRGLSAHAVYETLAAHDIRAAADVLRPVYEATGRQDGFVSLEVSPLHAHDTRGTIEEARRLWHVIARPNAMIKVPGTPEGIPAIASLVAEGVNVNVTLLFSRATYARVAEAYQTGLEARAGRGDDVSRIASVASFFVSRMDTLVDGLLDARARVAPDAAARAHIEALRGRAAIANAKLAYQDYRAAIATERWTRLAARGARPQRLLWASTSTKDPRYPPLYYVEALVGPETVNTVPPATFDALRRGAEVRATLEEAVDGARATLAELEALGISMESVTDRLLADGVRLFAEPFENLLAALEARRAAGAGAAR